MQEVNHSEDHTPHKEVMFYSVSTEKLLTADKRRDTLQFSSVH